MTRPQPRTYRNLVRSETLVSFRVAVKETDLHIQAGSDLTDVARERILHHRGHLETYIRRFPGFATTLVPWPSEGFEPPIVREMIAAGERAGVGPMAAVAGAVAAMVGSDLLPLSEDLIVENGGDIFICTRKPLTVGIFAARSPLSLRVGLRLDPGGLPVAVCTSSGTVGHSLSLGRADAACVVSDSCPLADAAATAIGNRVRTKSDIQPAISFGKSIDGVKGIVVILGEKMGVWGDLDLVPLGGKKG